MGNVVLIILLGLAAVAGLFGAARGHDSLFQAHAWVIVAASLVAIVALLQRLERPSQEDTENSYADGVVRFGVIATVFWGVVGFLVGLVIALQLAFPELNLGYSFSSFGRLRPLHTSAVIFAFGGNALIATSFYIVQRTSAARLWGGNLAWFVFWGYQIFIVLAATGYVLGGTQSKEYAEPEWYVDIWLTLVWVAYLAVFLGTIIKRKEPHIYVANWFLLSFIVTVAMLHVVNNLTIPVSVFGSKSVHIFTGVQDALVVPYERSQVSEGLRAIVVCEGVDRAAIVRARAGAAHIRPERPGAAAL